jgi:hypothetical protein
MIPTHRMISKLLKGIPVSVFGFCRQAPAKQATTVLASFPDHCVLAFDSNCPCLMNILPIDSAPRSRQVQKRKTRILT